MPSGSINLKKSVYRKDFTALDDNCGCSTCKTYTKAYIHSIVTQETVACHLITIHNIAYQVCLLCWQYSAFIVVKLM